MSLPNIVFILCDDLGINDLHCYGREDHNTPNLDRLASEGTRFTSAYCSQPICSASRAGLLTGLNPARLHLTSFLPGRGNCAAQKVLHPEIMMNIPLETRTWPKFFNEAGYATGLIGKWHVGGPGFGPLDHGFDYAYAPEKVNTEPSETEGGKAEFELTRATLDFIEQNRERPFAAYLGHHTPHIPYTARIDLIDKNKNAFEPVYAGLIESLDNTVGLLMERLEEMGLSENTIIVFTSDNGGLHVPEGSHRRVTHNTPFRAGKGYVYEGGNRIPLIVRWPGHIPAGRVVDTPVNNIDWIPTLLELAGQDIPEGLDGISFAKGLTDTGDFPEKPIFWHFPHYTNQGSRPSGAMRDGDWLLVEFYDEEILELYNLSGDIGEKSDLSENHPERVTSMREALDKWRKENNVQYNTPNPECNKDLFRKIYKKIDVSLFDPLNADENEWRRVHDWREMMDAACRKI